LSDCERVPFGPLDRVDVWLSLGLAAIALAVFGRAAGFDFVSFDDPAVVLAHPNLYDETSLLASLRAILVDYFPREEPLLFRDITWAIDARLFGFANPFGYHLGNVVLHATNSLLLFLVLRRMLGDRRVCFGVAACFAVLPVHVEPVAWVMGRKDLLAAFFLFCALLVQSYELQASRAGRLGRRRALYAAGLACIGLALVSKASAVVFFLVLALHRMLEPWLEGRLAPRASLDWTMRGRAAAIAIAPHAALSVAFFVWYRAVTEAYGVVQQGGPGPFDPEHVARIAQFAPLVLGTYLAHVVWPVELSMYYRWPHVEIPLSTPQLLLAAVLALAFAAGLLTALLRRRDLLFFALLPFVLLLPYTGLFYVGFWSADRYVYAACAGPLVLAALGLRSLAARGPAAGTVVAALGCLFFAGSAAKAWQHQEVWRSDEALWQYEAHRSEPSLLAIQSLARSYLKRAEQSESVSERGSLIDRAEAEIERGFVRDARLGRVKGRYGVPEQLHLARLHYLRGRAVGLRGAAPAEQVVHYSRAFELAPERLTAIYTSSGLFQMAGRAEGADRQRLVERSFDYFAHYVEMSHADPLQRDESLALLEHNYLGRFPYLDDRVEQMMRVYYP